MVFDDLNGTPLDNKSKQQKNKNKIEASTLRPAVSTPSYIASVNQLCRTWKRRCFVATPDTLCYCRWGCCCTSVLKFTSIYLHDTLNRSVYIWMSYIPHSVPQMSRRRRGKGVQSQERPLWLFEQIAATFQLFSSVWTQRSWKFDFSEAYDNCQCLQFRSSAMTSTDPFHS